MTNFYDMKRDHQAYVDKYGEDAYRRAVIRSVTGEDIPGGGGKDGKVTINQTGEDKYKVVHGKNGRITIKDKKTGEILEDYNPNKTGTQKGNHKKRKNDDTLQGGNYFTTGNNNNQGLKNNGIGNNSTIRDLNNNLNDILGLDNYKTPDYGYGKKTNQYLDTMFKMLLMPMLGMWGNDMGNFFNPQAYK